MLYGWGCVGSGIHMEILNQLISVLDRPFLQLLLLSLQLGSPMRIEVCLAFSENFYPVVLEVFEFKIFCWQNALSISFRGSRTIFGKSIEERREFQKRRYHIILTWIHLSFVELLFNDNAELSETELELSLRVYSEETSQTISNCRIGSWILSLEFCVSNPLMFWLYFVLH